MVTANFWEAMGANGVLALGYIIYKVADRLLGSKCKYTRNNGWDFDLGDPGPCPAAELDKMGDLLKQRSMLFRKGAPKALAGSRV